MILQLTAVTTFVTAGFAHSFIDDSSAPDFASEVRPILAEHCFACHGADAASREADLRLDLREAAVESEAIVPHDPAASSIVERIESSDADVVMPPPETNKALTGHQIDILKRWIENGATYAKHWSFTAPEKKPLPKVSNTAWPQNEIDRIVLAKLEANQLQPAAPAQPERLFRRLHLDLTGLPPKPADVKAFVKAFETDSQQAISNEIDRLMKTPAWGEHRARYWLDAARYGDTHGLHFDNYREMWPYRDWVIRAFNSNQPFDEFTVDQLAGDLLEEPTQDQLVATGFQRCNITTNEGGTIDDENLANYAADRVQTFGWVYLGLTTNCCQCHDHKFDPLTAKDYYSLAAYFRNTTQLPKDGNVKDGRGPTIRVYSEEHNAAFLRIKAQQKKLTAQLTQFRADAKDSFQRWLASNESKDLSIPDAELALHVPLNEGKARRVSGITGLEKPIQGPKGTRWVKDGIVGPAIDVHSAGIVSLGQVGNRPIDRPFTISLWVRPKTGQGTSPIVAKMDEANGYRGWDVWREGTDYAMHLIDSWPGNAMKIATSDKSLVVNTWQHVSVVYDGSQKAEGVKIYVDGRSRPTRILSRTINRGANTLSRVPLKIGQRSQGPVFSGAIQDLRIYSRAITDAEATQLFQNTPLKSLLAVPEARRTKEQSEQLFDRYVTTVDETFQKLTQIKQQLQAERKAIENSAPLTHIQREREDRSAMANILMRGAYDAVGENVTAAPPAAFHPLPENAPANRLGLAQWVVAGQNPLTARVTVNRFWQEVFGTGIVATTEDFGIMGMPPANQELLDWLAVDFQENGWDVKRLFKQMLMSATYQQAAFTTEDKLLKDRDNAWLSRGPKFRMDAEMLRDTALSTSDLLSFEMFGPGTKPYQPSNIWNIVGLPSGNTREYVQDEGENLYRRSVYTFWKRMAPPPNMETFNAPSREVCTVRRERTNTPLQALVTLNDPQFVEAARVLAQNALSKKRVSDQVIAEITARILGRPLSPQETDIVQTSLSDLLAHYHSDEAAAKQLIAIGETPTTDDVSAAELAAWTMVCNQLMNLDEALCK